MSQEKFDNEQTFRRFLLGEMTEDERSVFEEKFVADEEFFSELRVVEDELIEAYARGFLNETDRKLFEKNFLTTARRRERVAFTQSMLGTIAAKEPESKKTSEQSDLPSSVWQSVLAFFAHPVGRFAMAFALIIVAFIALWFLVKNQKPEQQANQYPPKVEPTLNPSPHIPNNNTPPDVAQDNKNQNAPNVNQNTPPTTIATVVLSAGGVRSNGSTQQLNLTKDTKTAHLQLLLESTDYKTYRAEILNADGQTIFRYNQIKPQKKSVSANVPATALKNGDYIIKLYGQTTDGASESVADYQLRVIHK